MNNTAKTQNSGATARSVLLPEDTSMALNMLIRLTGNLSHLADRESQALAQNDMLTFAILQDEKALVTQQYMQASEEFRTNLNMYRGVEKGLLDRLERLQKELGEKTTNNNSVVEKIHERAQTRTQSSLLAAQEIGQTGQMSDRRINFEATNENKGGK